MQITEEALKEHFSQYGNIEEVKILTKPDGKRLGCGFVQFDLVQSAAKAVHYANMKPLLGRSIVVDRALPKTKFDKDTETADVKPDIEEIEIKEEEEHYTKEKNKSNDADSEDSDEYETKEEDASSRDEEDSVASMKDEEDEEDNDGKMKIEGSVEEEKSTRPRVISNDVSEGKTVFLKNVPFAVTNEELKECMEQYGPVYYALVCMDPLTEHSKGTAFVKFRVMMHFYLFIG